MAGRKGKLANRASWDAEQVAAGGQWWCVWDVGISMVTVFFFFFWSLFSIDQDLKQTTDSSNGAFLHSVPSSLSPLPPAHRSVSSVPNTDSPWDSASKSVSGVTDSTILLSLLT